MTTEDIRIDSANGIGFIALDRPKALNALSAPMLRAISEALRAWRHDQAIRTVVVYSPHVRAFCAGGDIRFLYESAQAGDRDSIDAFFTDEYKLNHAIFTFPKPYIAVMNGVVMGGGMGISQGAHHTGGLRIVTQSTKMAMPETRIGLFPDVGVSWFLARAPGAIGRYLAATGASMGAADALYARMADAYLDDGALPGLIESLRHQRFLDGVAIVRFVENETTKYKVSPTLDRSALAEDARSSTSISPRAMERRFSHRSRVRRMAPRASGPSAWRRNCANVRLCRWMSRCSRWIARGIRRWRRPCAATSISRAPRSNAAM